MRAGRTFISTTAAAALAGCLLLPEKAVENRGRAPLEVEATGIEDGQRGIARNASIEVRFNQPLDPASLESIGWSLSSGELLVRADVRYDALTRTLVFDPRSDLREDLWYRFTIEAFPLSIMGTQYTGEPLEVRFRTGTHFEPATPRPEVGFEEDVWPILSGCACHDRETRFMDYVIVYDVDRPELFLEHGVGTPSREWRDWLVVDPGRHESSYLMYKLLGNDRLGMPTVMGDVMPPGGPLPMQSLETIRDWIEQGAN